ncbi:MAG: hypothetical protein FE037_05570 [Thermoplasmata archaeon]|nr:MAG: hypothetical protein FE037_05570 [Thermoplasmata archaeon]
MKFTGKLAILCAFLLFLMPATASVQKSVDDPQGDVQDMMSGTVNMPDIDIKKITYWQTDDGSVTITLQVYGSIDSNSIYMIVFNTTDNGKETMYNAYYTKNKDLAEMSGFANESGIEALTSEYTWVTVNGSFDIPESKVLRLRFNLLNPGESPVNITAMTLFMDISSEIPSTVGMDYATMEFELPSQNNNQQNNNQQNQGNNNNKNGFPGFEAAFLIAAISIAALLRRKIL